MANNIIDLGITQIESQEQLDLYNKNEVAGEPVFKIVVATDLSLEFCDSVHLFHLKSVHQLVESLTVLLHQYEGEFKNPNEFPSCCN